MLRFLGCCLLAAAAFVPAFAAGRGEPGRVFAVRVELNDRLADLKLFHDLDLDVDGVFGTWARVYVIEEELGKLRELGFVASELPEEIPGPEPEAAAYHTYETLTAELQQIAADHPSIARLHSIGKSVQGRDLWIMKITDNPDAQEDEPEVRYIAAMHGDEVVGKEMCIELLHWLTDRYATDSRVSSLVDSTEIWILPSMNPDGTAALRRYNANNYDLNRDFPDQYDDPADTPAGRQPETQHVMNWTSGTSPVLTANFHGGAVVANYPYDSTPSGVSTYAVSPDDSTFVSIARTYADANPTMFASNADASFDRGICNGSDWYAIRGGMQDWMYVWRGGKEITLEVSAAKWPAANQLGQFWTDNRESMLRYLERAHEGLRGIVRGADSGAPLAATITTVGNDMKSFTDPQVGDYHRLLTPGRYDVRFSATGYASRIVRDVEIAPGSPPTRLDVALDPLAVDLQPDAVRVVDGANGVLDAGESTDLAVTLRNLGSAASGITATIVPTTAFARATRPQAAFPNLAAGAAAESLAPHFGVEIDPAVPDGHKVGFAFAWTSAEGSGTSEPFFLSAKGASCTTVAASDTPKSILDRATASSTLAFPSNVEIASVRVRTDIGHTYVGDLHVKVVSPSGVPVMLHSRTGGSADDIVAWFPTDRTSAEPLSRLVGEPSSGTWRLEVNDGVPSNTGQLRGWSVEICGRPFEASTPEMKFRSVARDASGATFAWWSYPGLTGYRVYRSTSPANRAAFADVSSEDLDASPTAFRDAASGPVLYYLVSGVGPAGEGTR
ncbi:MAG TPA: M14 family zinc carboxypeptidase [Candidatus Polarisedimenticolaceae bacterium]